jgi:hypothetical protein
MFAEHGASSNALSMMPGECMLRPDRFSTTKLSLSLKTPRLYLGDKPLALPNLGHAVGMLRFDLRNGGFVAIRLEPFGAVKVADTV